MCVADQVIKNSIINTEIQMILFTNGEPFCFVFCPHRDHLCIFRQHGNKGTERSEVSTHTSTSEPLHFVVKDAFQSSPSREKAPSLTPYSGHPADRIPGRNWRIWRWCDRVALKLFWSDHFHISNILCCPVPSFTSWFFGKSLWGPNPVPMLPFPPQTWDTLMPTLAGSAHSSAQTNLELLKQL